MWIVDGFTQDDHRAIGAIRQAQDRRISGAAQGLMIALQHDGLADFNGSGRQHHFPATFRQHVQHLLDFGAGRARMEGHHHRLRGRDGGGRQTGRRKGQQPHA